MGGVVRVVEEDETIATTAAAGTGIGAVIVREGGMEGDGVGM